jgi:hypothetical protein
MDGGRMGHEERGMDSLTEPCQGPACDRPSRANGLCDSHYRQHRRHGRTYRLARYQRACAGNPRPEVDP